MVNTFLPYASFKRSARMLDRPRLGRQRTEVVIILRALHGETRGYAHHPATIMWRGCEVALISYGLHVCEEWTRRGYVDNQAAHMRAFLPGIEMMSPTRLRAIDELPWWFGWAKFHRSHRSNLVRKDDYHYDFDGTPPHLPYIWPRDVKGEWKAQHAKGSPYGP